jgi:hypothetical protein
LFYALVAFLKKWAQIKNDTAMRYKGLAKNIAASQSAERVQTTKGCKLAQGIKTKKHKTNIYKTRTGCTVKQTNS